MSLINLLDEKLIQLPIKAHGDDTYYPSYISELLMGYIKLLRKYKVSEHIICSVSEFGEKIFLLLLSYYRGDHYNAYKNFKCGMEIYEEDLDNWVVEIEEIDLYRARINNEGCNDFKADEMFHIPFEQRTKVSTQRYSFPGLPCLYLGESPYVCWLELNSPPIDTFNIARIHQKEGVTLRVLDISDTPDMVKIEYNTSKDEERLLEYLKIWPLIAVCSVCVRDERGSFKPEYIISQMLLEWLIEIDIFRKHHWIDGIKYFSVRATMNKNQNLHANYVFPTVDNYSEKDLCTKLKSKFTVAKVMSGKTMQLQIPQYNSRALTDYLSREDNYSQEKIVFPSDETILHSEYLLYWFEKILCDM